jgi:hypothetical protein
MRALSPATASELARVSALVERAALGTPGAKPKAGRIAPLTISFYEAAMRAEAEYQKAHGDFAAWCARARLDQAVFEQKEEATR